MAFAQSGYALALANAAHQALPSPWTEHIAPSGYLYYYNPYTLESTYNRPLSLLSNTTLKHKAKKKKKEKPAKKTPIPDSSWLRVLTNRGNVFYANTETKESTWEVPVGIEQAVEVLEAQEAAALEDAKTMDASGSPGTKRKVRDDDGGEKRAGKRLKKEFKPTIGVEEEGDEGDEEAWQRRLAEEMADEEMEGGDGGDALVETKEEDKVVEEVPAVPTMPLEEATQIFKTILQEKQVNPMHPWETSLPLITSDERYTTLENSLALPSQRDIFEEYCKEILKERKAAKEPSSTTTTTTSAYDGYRQLLKDTVTSTRMTYTQFRQQVKKERRFYSYGRDEKEREREFRTYLKELGEIKKNERKRAEEAFIAMLKEGKSTRKGTSSKKWNEVKKEFQKDSRYDAVGSSTLREELYETFLKSLKGTEETSKDGEEGEIAGNSNDGTTGEVQLAGPSAAGEDEKKRRREKAVREREERVRMEKERTARDNARSRAGLNQEEAELAFNSLLVDTVRDPTTTFPSAIQYLSSDPRFTRITQPSPSSSSSSGMTHARLSTLFNAHIAHLQSKGSTILHTLFESHAPGLDMRWEDLPVQVNSSIAGSAVVKRLGLDGSVSVSVASRPRAQRGSEEEEEEAEEEEEGEGEGERVEYPALRHEFERWQRQRFTDARTAFDTMLSENAFVEFWGRVGKMGLTDQEEKARLGKVVFAEESAGVVGMEVDEEEEGGDAGEGGGGKRDLQALAKGIDVKEVERVLRRDKRFVVFDYMTKEREEWIRDYLRGLSAPKASVHVG